jgi:prepilin signal peptidase PulO-like enzyme (type II secretory pathway)
MTSVVSITSLVDVVEVLLIVLLLREMPPIRFAARYLVIPLLTILESFVLMRPEWTIRMGFGTALLAAGAGTLLFWKAGEEEIVLSLR